MPTKTKIDPIEHDTKLAALYFDRDKAERALTYARHALLSEAGAEYYYRRNKRVTDMTVGEARTILQARGDKKAQDAVEKVLLANNAIDILDLKIDDLEAFYYQAPWSRFFLVTSSQGHVHSSMRCHTCRPTTRYGWLPEFSGATEEAIVKVLGSTLCSECFKSAPVEYQGGKLSKKEAETLAWSPDRDEKAAKREAERQAKAEAKVKKAASKLRYDESLAHKVNALIDLKLSDNDTYAWTWTHKGYDNAYYVLSDMRRRRV